MSMHGGGAYRCEPVLAPLLFTLTSLLVLGPAGLKLVSNGLLTHLLSLLPVDGFHQHTLVLEHITLDLQDSRYTICDSRQESCLK